MKTLAHQVEELDAAHTAYRDLLGEVLATLTLPANQNEKLSSIPNLVRSWVVRSWNIERPDLAGKTEPCCGCGEDYPRYELHVLSHIHCPRCRK